MKCNEEQVRGYLAGSKYNIDATRDLAADWLELVAEIEHYKDRERHFAKALQVADGGDYRADWDGAISRVIAERDSLRKRLADAEATIEAANSACDAAVTLGKKMTALDERLTEYRAKESK